MFMIFKKKQMVITALVFMLGIAGYLNYRYDVTGNEETTLVDNMDISEPETGETVMVNAKSKEEKEDIFASQRLNRDTTRAKLCDELKQTLEKAEISQEMRAQTEEKLSKILELEELETTAQNLLFAKGFENTFVYITDGGVTVSIKHDGISRSDTAKIVDVIYELTKNNNIKIVEVG